MEKEEKQDRVRSDREIRNDEMAEGKSPDEVAEIYKKGDKYYCAECHSELPVKQACPVCHKELDWDRIMIERR
ncbi:MAG: hypothetical protein JXA46_19470 [Dehalococcoidales bacterium]|nr:hypothetical protein [Dehalococcoidales bacterium]